MKYHLPTIGKLGARLPELVEERVGHCLHSSHAPQWGILQQLGNLHRLHQITCL